MFRKQYRHAGTGTPVPTKTTLLVQLTLMLLFNVTSLYAEVPQKSITLKVDHVSLEKVFSSIQAQTGFGFLYVEAQLAQTKPVTIDVKNATLEEVLALCFKDQPLEYSISEVDKVVVLKLKPVKKEVFDLSPPGTVKGRVVNQDGEPIAGISVVVKGGAYGVSTDGRGEFVLKNIDPNATLVFSGVTVETQELVLTGRVQLVVVMISKQNKLDEVQVVAYGTTTQRYNTGNVSVVKAVEIEKQPVNNVLLALEGRVPGVFITQSSGVPGGGVKVKIQGQNSLNRGTDPLYVIDGVPYSGQSLPNLSGSLGILGDNGNTNTAASFGGGSPLGFLNTADIESISILKDADATAIFGSRASNGAILIFTKRGKTGKIKYDLNIQHGIGKVTRFMPLLTTSQYLSIRKEAFRNDNLLIPNFKSTPSNADYDLNGAWDTTRNTDWQKTLIGNIAPYSSAQLDIYGGDNNTQVLIGSGIHKEGTVFPGSLTDTKGSFHFSLNNKSSNRKLSLQLTADYLIDKNNLINTDLTNLALKIAPDAPALYKDGQLNWAPVYNGVSEISSWQNPLSYLENKYSINTNNLIANSVVGYQILDNLNLKASLGYTNTLTSESILLPLSSYAPETRSSKNRISQFSNSNTSSWSIEPTIDYSKELGRFKTMLLVGATFLNNNSSASQYSASGFNSDQTMHDIKSASSIFISQSLISQYRYNALFGRFNINFKNRYILNVSARRDGSSRFGIKNLFHNFSSIGTGWIFSNEGWCSQYLKFISFGKLKFSFGTTGNDQIGDYQYLSLYTPYTVPIPYQGVSAYLPSNPSNPYLQWEETRKLEFGTELGFFSDRLFLSATYYRNKSSNLLQGYAVPQFTGVSNIQVNFPATVENRGFEFTLNYKLREKKKMEWSLYLNLTIPKNSLVDFPNLYSSTYANTYVIGSSIRISKAYNLLGVDPATGLFQYLDYKGLPTTSPSSVLDKQTLFNTDPKYYGGLENVVNFHGFEFSFLVQYVNQIAQGYYYGNRPGLFGSNATVAALGNQPTWVLNRWRSVGDLTNVQKVSTSYSLVASTNSSISDANYNDASFLRVKNVSLSWDLSNVLIQRGTFRRLKLYLNCQNLLTITDFKGMDPENKSLTSIPPLRIITGGLQIGL